MRTPQRGVPTIEVKELGSMQNEDSRPLYRRSGNNRVTALDVTVARTIAKVKEQPDQQPDDQSHPVSPAESINHRAADKDAEDGHHRQRRHPETSFQVGAPNPHYPDTQADQN